MDPRLGDIVGVNFFKVLEFGSTQVHYQNGSRINVEMKPKSQKNEEQGYHTNMGVIEQIYKSSFNQMVFSKKWEQRNLRIVLIQFPAEKPN